MSAFVQGVDRFYSLLARLSTAPGQGLRLRQLKERFVLPRRGVYFFMESGEFRVTHPEIRRIVRIGTHAVSAGSKSLLGARLGAHLGTRTGGGNHRGSIFRLHVGAALLARDGLSLPSWGVGSALPPQVRGNPVALAAEAELERRVSAHIGEMTVLWVAVPDEPGPLSMRAYIERNTIALLSNKLAPLDVSSSGWLGRFSPRAEIRHSALWNLRHVQDECDLQFLPTLESLVTLTREDEPRSK
ncbi:hypothetical protein [Variovorax sp. YR216]|uniref:hypothetical protein n=1 Tax=Variovorax sp. YR216 TaxID=1882828 RepID=UPI0008994821|nr:hypothetical protein [Variovorax sp. YR216]SEA16942.1 hypothetical protein SAMN05444680_101759 [Variovorax sp. YR216]